MTEKRKKKKRKKEKRKKKKNERRQSHKGSPTGIANKSLKDGNNTLRSFIIVLNEYMNKFYSLSEEKLRKLDVG